MTEFGRRDLFKKVAISGAGLAALSSLTKIETASAAVAQVPKKVLGATGEEIPILLMGGSQKFDATYDKMLHRAFKTGMTYIDTAESYANGQSQKTLGPFVDQVGRDKLWLTSKVELHGKAARPETFKRKMEESIGDLHTDYLDMFFMHGVKDEFSLDPEYIKMGEEMKKSGFSKYFGFSCHDGNVVQLMNKAAKIGAPGIDAIMFRYNFTMYGNLELNRAMDACVKAGIGLIAMKTQTSVPEDNEEVKKFVSENFTLHQARLKAAWADERITSCVSGINNTRILQDNSKAAISTTQLTMNEMMQLHQYAARTASSRCQGCNQICEARVEGDLRIADTLRYLMYDECYGDHEEAHRLYTAMTVSERSFVSIDLRAATAACPQGIDIAKRLAEAHTRLA